MNTEQKTNQTKPFTLLCKGFFNWFHTHLLTCILHVSAICECLKVVATKGLKGHFQVRHSATHARKKSTFLKIGESLSV